MHIECIESDLVRHCLAKSDFSLQKLFEIVKNLYSFPVAR